MKKVLICLTLTMILLYLLSRITRNEFSKVDPIYDPMAFHDLFDNNIYFQT